MERDPLKGFAVYSGTKHFWTGVIIIIIINIIVIIIVVVVTIIIIMMCTLEPNIFGQVPCKNYGNDGGCNDNHDDHDEHDDCVNHDGGYNHYDHD